MLTCKQASELVSKKLDGELAWRSRIALNIHLMMCGLCRRYARDVGKLHALMRHTGNDAQALLPESLKLSAKARERIRQRLSNEDIN